MQTVLSNMISNPDSYVTSDEIKRDLSEMIDRDELIEIYQKYIWSLRHRSHALGW